MGFPAEVPQAIGDTVTLMTQSVAGLYLSRKKTLYIVGEHARSAKGSIHLDSFDTLGDELTLAHEAIHALQHLHYPDLFEPDQVVWPQQTDATLALRAAKEGDASLWAAQSFGFLGRAKDPEDVLEASREQFGPLSDAPSLLRELVVFPYTYGYRFAYHEGKLGLASPPASTEQIIHLERNGRRAFQAMDLSDFARSLEMEGCRVLYQDTMGELTLSLWLRSFDPTITQIIWEGWDGDRWIAAACQNGREVAWLTSWDSEKDASEFERTVIGIAAIVQGRANLTSPLSSRTSRKRGRSRQRRTVVEDRRPETDRYSSAREDPRRTGRAFCQRQVSPPGYLFPRTSFLYYLSAFNPRQNLVPFWVDLSKYGLEEVGPINVVS